MFESAIKRPFSWVTDFKIFSRIFIATALLQAMAGPSLAQSAHEFWLEEQERLNPQRRQRSLSLKEYLTPYLERLYNCWYRHLDSALTNRVPPQDFARIIEGTCVKETTDYSSAVVNSWATQFNDMRQGRILAADLISNGRKYIISIYTERWYSSARKRDTAPDAPESWAGSGFFITAAGHLLTNEHVVRNCANPVIRIRDGASVNATVIALDDKADLALLKTNLVTNHFATFRIDPEPQEGDQVAVFGFPLPGTLSSTGNATFGYISATKGLRDNPNHLQISAAVQSGNSGGPLLDISGNVIGVVFAKLGIEAAIITGDLPQNINFAVKSAVATHFIASQAIAFTKSSETRNEMDKAEITNRAKNFSVQILCNRAAPSLSASEATNSIAQMKHRTGDFLVQHYSRISSDNVTAMQAAKSSYASHVDYFGKSMTYNHVISKIDHFLERWPWRSYKIKPQSVIITCDEISRSCKARGQITFDAKSASRGQRSVGESNFEFTLAYGRNSNSPLITQEGGEVIQRQLESYNIEDGE